MVTLYRILLLTSILHDTFIPYNTVGGEKHDLLPIIPVTEKCLLPGRKAIVPLFLMGMTGVALFNILQFTALSSSSATNVSIISTMNTLSIALFSALLLRERLRGAQIDDVRLLFRIVRCTPAASGQRLSNPRAPNRCRIYRFNAFFKHYCDDCMHGALGYRREASGSDDLRAVFKL